MKSKKLTIFGYPVSHSISPKMHTLAIEGLRIDASYTKSELKDGDRLKEIFLKEFDGANVTVPHKEVAFSQCDEVRGDAKEIKAVNTIINESGKMVGFNTDAKGFLLSIKEFTDVRKILILGAGGTAKAISYILKKELFDVTILNRSQSRLEDFKGFETFTWGDFRFENFDLIVNTTSAGLSDDFLPLPKEMLQKIFANAKYAVDVIYNKNTPFLKMANEFKLPNKDGSDMLLYQGVLAFLIFFEDRFSFEEVEKFMRGAFNHSES
jgi:shikimate dehydrogenase